MPKVSSKITDYHVQTHYCLHFTIVIDRKLLQRYFTLSIIKIRVSLLKGLPNMSQGLETPYSSAPWARPGAQKDARTTAK